VNTSLCNKCQIHTKFFCLQTVDPIVNGLVSSASDNPKRLWQSTNSYTTNPPHCYPPLLLALHLQTALLLFFHKQNIQTLSFSRQQPCYIISTLTLSSCHSPSFLSFHTCLRIRVHKILSNCTNKQHDSDPIPTWLLKECSFILVSTITNIVNLSLTTGHFHPTIKESITPLLKKLTLYKEELYNYRPISNRSLISKIIERVINPVSWINQSFYFRNKPISEIDRKMRETEETTKIDKNIVHTIRIEAKCHTQILYRCQSSIP